MLEPRIETDVYDPRSFDSEDYTHKFGQSHNAIQQHSRPALPRKLRVVMTKEWLEKRTLRVHAFETNA